MHIDTFVIIQYIYRIRTNTLSTLYTRNIGFTYGILYNVYYTAYIPITIIVNLYNKYN